MAVLLHFTHYLVQGEPGSPGMMGLPGIPGRGLPGQKVTTTGNSQMHTLSDTHARQALALHKVPYKTNSIITAS